MQNKQWLTVDEAGKVLGIHPITLRNKLITKEIPAKKVGREWRILKKDINNILGITSEETDKDKYILLLEEKIKYLESQVKSFKKIAETLTEIIN